MLTENEFDNLLRERIKTVLIVHHTTINAIAKGDLTLQRKLNGQISEGRRITPFTLFYIYTLYPDVPVSWLFGVSDEL